ncbi:type II secretion system protein GspL [Pseudomonas protegens]|uniref:type II secretion system protein GspL n=1 Tax=Pseudomonas protegens TaxID=380021 RepID=UPI00276C36E2|nr:type II secretion system protein GspL [Pseudomonas protegens]MDP9504490.1 type II secretion system protein GspL [Pseudomonas protegens]
MSHWLYLSPHTTGDTPWRCHWWSAGSTPQQGSLEQAAEQLREHGFVLLLPMEMASFHQVSVPARSGRWLRQALHSALEEHLIDDVEHLHMAHGPLRERRHCSVLVINRERLQRCLKRLAEHGLQPSRMHIDADCLPLDRPRALAWDGRWLLGGSAPLRLTLSDQELGDLSRLVPDGLLWQGAQTPGIDGLEPQHWQVEEQPWQVLSQGSLQAIDLCQGQFQRRTRKARPWRLALLVLAIAGGAHLLQNIGHRLYLEQRSDQLHAASQSLWQERFADEPVTADLARQVRLKQRQQVQETPGVALRLSQLAEQWVASGGALSMIQRLDYQAEEGWSLQVSAPAFADLQMLREGLINQGLSVSTDSSVRDAQGVSARFQIKE